MPCQCQMISIFSFLSQSSSLFLRNVTVCPQGGISLHKIKFTQSQTPEQFLSEQLLISQGSKLATHGQDAKVGGSCPTSGWILHPSSSPLWEDRSPVSQCHLNERLKKSPPGRQNSQPMLQSVWLCKDPAVGIAPAKDMLVTE